MTTTQALTVGETAIRQHDGLYSLNDLHRASGGEAKHQPALFIRLDTTQALLRELSSTDSQSLKTVLGKGKNQGTYACRELVIAYAAWISPAFQLKVIRVFLDTVATPQQALPPPVPTRTLNFTFTVPANDRTARWLLHTDRQGREVVTELSPETHLITAEQWIHRLMHSPADLNLTLSQILTITHACLNAMRTSTGLYASRLNIQPVKHTPAPRGPFVSLGMPAGTVPTDPVSAMPSIEQR